MTNTTEEVSVPCTEELTETGATFYKYDLYKLLSSPILKDTYLASLLETHLPRSHWEPYCIYAMKEIVECHHSPFLRLAFGIKKRGTQYVITNFCYKKTLQLYIEKHRSMLRK